MPVYGIFDRYGDLVVYNEGDDPADVGTYTDYTGYMDLGECDAGNYELWVFAVPCYSDGELVDDWDDDSWDVPGASVEFKVKELLPPSVVKAKAGKKKVTVTFSRATGAQKYVIYRNNSKYGTYSRIGTTYSTKYIDRRVKKGKRYYYCVCSYRTSSDLEGELSRAARCRKVR